MDSEQVQDLLIKIPQISTYLDVAKYVGEGTYSKVYSARFRDQYNSSMYEELAVKHVTPIVKQEVIQKEVKLLKQLEGRCNIVKLLFVLVNETQVAMVMPFFKSDKFSNIVKNPNLYDIRNYTKSLLLALKHLDDNSIIHRDIKPNNFLFSRKDATGVLIDFGLAETVSPQRLDDKDDVFHDISNRPIEKCSGKSCECKHKDMICATCLSFPAMNANRAGTAGYRPPEVVLRVKHQTTAVDIWACGVILFSLLCGRYPIFDGPDDLTQITLFMSLFGKEKVIQTANSMNRHLIVGGFPYSDPQHQRLQELCIKLRQADAVLQPKPGKKSKNTQFDVTSLPDSAFDLLERLLTLDPAQRITAAKALDHPFILHNHTIERIISK